MMKTIDIRTNINSAGLYARKIWEVLFREVKAWEWKNLDSFLCDLKSFERVIEDGYKEMYWECSDSGYTQIYLDPIPTGPYRRIFKITIKPADKITIEEV